MAPTVTWRGKPEGRPEDEKPEKLSKEQKKAKEDKEKILAGCQAAAAHVDFRNFVTMEIWNGPHKSGSDKREHATVRVRTQEQISQVNNGTHQVAHIYLDEEKGYSGRFKGFKDFEVILDRGVLKRKCYILSP
ncbi:hypothetical protein QBC46DRAFT_413870 [Diplogelasinospora grovesii]|uniref:Uncharacterized protein n=1 Tax=Diplogelasinospora grovesii TaxID=303347 RepID=A0AAN6MVY2_9PEZI|nr:hypothetical protein QBC46DRAFT_413870 [Diplogelasinospora grovesii]